MKRRQFLQQAIPAAVIPSVLNGFSARVLGDHPMLNALLNTYVESDKVLVIIQLNGGNDGLNMVIPMDQYGNYYKARTNIAIPENKVLKLSGTNAVGLHPSMTGLQSLYNSGKLRLVQAVGYPNPNFSHFRATDIWLGRPLPQRSVSQLSQRLSQCCHDRSAGYSNRIYRIAHFSGSQREYGCEHFKHQQLL